MRQFYYLFFKQYSKYFKSILIFSFFINLLVLTPAWFMLQVYDRVLTSYDDNTLFGLGLIAAYLLIVYFFLEKYRRLALIEIGKNIYDDFDKKLKIIITQQITINSRVIYEIQNYLEQIKNFISKQNIIALIDAPWTIVFVMVMFVIHPVLGVIAFCSILVIFYISWVGNKQIKSFSQLFHKAKQKKMFQLQSVHQDLEGYHIMGMKNKILNLFDKQNNEVNEKESQINENSTVINLYSKFFRVFVQSFILAVGAYLALRGEITLGMIIAGTILLGRTLAPIDLLINNLNELKKFQYAYSLVKQFVHQHQIKNKSSFTIEQLSGKILLENIHFYYPKQDEFIKNINLTIEAGECLGIVGHSGSGKTTMIKLLSGILKPVKGKVFYDDHSVSDINWNQTDFSIGYLAQQTSLIEGTIAENISRFQDCDLEEVKKTCQKINIHRDISNLKNGYDSMLDTGGSGLSYGQSRQIAIARALYNNPAIIFFDEPTLGLDNQAILNLIEVIKILKKEKKTIIISSHVPNLLLLTDKVMFLEKGTVKALGQTNQIIKKVNQSSDHAKSI